jgi:hypothetical protein
MRGFRGSRAAQNVMSFRHGRHGTTQTSGKGPTHANGQPHDQNRQQIPDWLKTPETREREAREAREAKHHHAPVAHLPHQGELAKVIPIRAGMPVQQHSKPKAHAPVEKPKAKAPVAKKKAAPVKKRAVAAKPVARKAAPAKKPRRKAA